MDLVPGCVAYFYGVGGVATDSVDDDEAGEAAEDGLGNLGISTSEEKQELGEGKPDNCVRENGCSDLPQRRCFVIFESRDFAYSIWRWLSVSKVLESIRISYHERR